MKIKAFQLSKKKVVESRLFDEIILPKLNGDSIVGDDEFQNLVYRACKNKKWGLINAQFKFILKPKYDLIDLMVSNGYGNEIISRNKILAVLTKDKIVWSVYQLKEKKATEFKVSSIQSIGCEFTAPTMISEDEKACILRDKGNLDLRSFINLPILICTQGGEINKKASDRTLFQYYEEPDSDGNVNIMPREIQITEYYYRIKNAKWNILNLNSGKMEFTEWSDSIVSTLIKSSLKEYGDDYLDSLRISMLYGSKYLLNFTNENFEKIFDEIGWSVNKENRYTFFSVLIVYHSNYAAFHQLKNTANLNKIQSKFKKVELFMSYTQNFWVLKNADTARLYDFIQDTFHPLTFNEIWDGDLNLKTTFYENESVYYKCILNHQLGVYSFKNNLFLPINKYEDVDFLKGSHYNRFEFFWNPNLFFFTKLNGKWGMSTLNIIYDNNDSISIPFIYDEMQYYDKDDLVALKVRQGSTWKYIDFLNNEIDTLPNSNNRLIVKRFYDVNHEPMSKFLFLLNPMGKIVERAYTTTKSYSSLFESWGKNTESKTDTGSCIVGGKVLVYNEMMRKLVNEDLYDSIYLLTTENDRLQSSNDPERYHQFSFFNWGNPEHVNKMKNSDYFFTIPYFVIFKNGEAAIIDDKNHIVFPFTKEKITVYERQFVEEVKIPSSKSEHSENEEDFHIEHKYHSILQMETPKSKIEIPIKVEY